MPKPLSLPLILILCQLFAVWTSYAQSANLDVIQIPDSETSVKIDGELDEVIWQNPPQATGFIVHQPIDGAQAKSQTKVWVATDGLSLFIAAVCFDNDSLPYVVQSLKRDYSYPVTDGFAVFIDPEGAGSNGYSFACNPYGAQREGLLNNGGQFGVTTSWDQAWTCETRRYADRWTVEMRIPFKTMHFSQGSEWRINFGRNNLKINERSVWQAVPSNQNVANLSNTKGLNFGDAVPNKKGPKVSLIPYLKAGLSFDKVEGTIENLGDIGLDAKLGLGRGLNLDLTLNPDFSQVEVDAQVLDIDRFEIFFPEKRQFFIENNDLFSGFGFGNARPFFSRRIGLDNQGTVGISGGLRLSGNIDNNWRMGILNMQTKNDTTGGRVPQNYSMVTVQRKLFARSSISGFVTNRQVFQDGKFKGDDFNRVSGADFHYRSRKGKINAQLHWHQTLAEVDTNAFTDWSSQGAYLEYGDQNIEFSIGQQFVGKSHSSDLGFIPRTNFTRFHGVVKYKQYPKSDKVIRQDFVFDSEGYHNPSDLSLQDWTGKLGTRSSLRT